MRIQAEISLYPLKKPSLSQYILDFLNAVRRPGVTVSAGSMSTVIAGEREVVFQAVSEGFAHVSDQCQVVLVVKYSNACPTSTGKSDTSPCGPDHRTPLP